MSTQPVRPRPPARPTPPTASPSVSVHEHEFTAAGTVTGRIASDVPNYTEVARPAPRPRRPAPPTNQPGTTILPKEVLTVSYDEQKTQAFHEEQRESRTVPKAPGASIPAGISTTEGELRGYTTEAPGEIEQITMRQMHDMGIEAKHSLWKRMNRSLPENQFRQIVRRDFLPKGCVREDPPATGKPIYRGAVLWCCYCAEWTIFEDFTYVGSQRCIGCGISTKDFYNRSANKLWGVDL